MNPRSHILGRLSLAGLVLTILTVAGFAFDQPDDFVTGGGRITGTPSGAMANFGVKGGVDVNGVFFGDLNYVDHSDNMHVKSGSIFNYIVVNPTTRLIQGTASIDGVSGFTFVAVVSDAGEPGSSDTFSIIISNGYSASGTLQGGNVQLHDH